MKITPEMTRKVGFGAPSSESEKEKVLSTGGSPPDQVTVVTESTSDYIVAAAKRSAVGEALPKQARTTSSMKISSLLVVSRVRGRETSTVQSRDARLVATDCKRSRRSGAGSDKPKREGTTPNSPRRAGNAPKQQTQALLTPINNGCQDYMANANEGWNQPVW